MMPDPTRDGIDHINIYSGGKTAVGRWMSNFACEPIAIGRKVFYSIEGYWYWLGCYDDRLQTLYGYDAKRLGKQLCRSRLRDDPEFHEKIIAALTLKCKANAKMVACLRECDFGLPLTHYYVRNGDPILAGFGWLIKFWEDVRDGNDNIV